MVVIVVVVVVVMVEVEVVVIVIERVVVVIFHRDKIISWQDKLWHGEIERERKGKRGHMLVSVDVVCW